MKKTDTDIKATVPSEASIFNVGQSKMCNGRDLMPGVSVVIPTIGRVEELRTAIKSVRDQSLAASEIIVVVDGTEETRRDIAAVIDERVRTIATGCASNGNVARNAGVRAAMYNMVAFLDDDDVWYPEKLQTQIMKAESADANWVITSAVDAIGAGKRQVWPSRALRPNEPIADYLFVRESVRAKHRYLQISTWLGPTRLFVENAFDEKLRIHQDLDWILRAVRTDGTRLIQIDRPLVRYSINNSGSVSSESKWRDSLDWISDHEERVSRKAAGDFLLVVTHSFALRSGQLEPAREIRRIARTYRPSRCARFVATVKAAKQRVLAAGRLSPGRSQESHSYRLRSLGVSIEVSNLDTAAANVVSAALRAEDRGGRNSVRFINAYSLYCAKNDPVYRETLLSGGLNYPDGAPLAAMLRSVGYSHARQVRGPSLFRQVLAEGQKHGLRHMFLGGTPETINELVRVIGKDYPDAVIAGHYSPSFGAVDSGLLEECAKKIREHDPDLVWVALGTPKQDIAASRLASETGKLTLAVGAAFDFVAGTTPEAPSVFGRLYIEWLYRLLTEPKRLWRRYVFGNFRFAVVWLTEVIGCMFSTRAM